MKGFFFLFVLTVGIMFTSCLSLTGEIEVISQNSYRISLDYSVKSDFIRLKYIGGSNSVITLPLTEQEYQDFAAAHGGVSCIQSQFSRIEEGDRIRIRSQLTFSDPASLEDLLSCNTVLEDTTLTLRFDRGEGTPSEEAVTYINGFCAGETISMTIKAPGNQEAREQWSLRELLLEPVGPTISLAWEE